MRRLTILTLTAIIALLGLVGTAGAAPPKDTTVTTPPMLPGMDAMMAQNERDVMELMGLTGKDFEIAYMQMMRAHHLAAIDMAEMARDKAVHPALKDLARSIITDQQREIDQLEGWLKTWYGISQPAMMPMAGMDAMMAAMMRLNGFEFEQAFLQMMVHHHQGAVDMSALAPGRATRSEVLQFASGVIREQLREIRQMRDWALDWYGFDPLPMSHGGGSMPGMPNTGAGGGAGRATGPATQTIVGFAALGALLLVGGLRRRRVSAR